MNTEKPEPTEILNRVHDHTGEGEAMPTQFEIQLQRTEYMGGAVETVPYPSGAQVEVPKSGSERALVTENLNGCVATMTACETEDGRRIGQLTHFAPFMSDRQKRKVQELLTPDMRTAITKQVVLFFQKQRAGGVDDMKKFFEQELGDDVRIDIQLYESNTDEPHNGTIMVCIPPKGRGAVTYTTWQRGDTVELIHDTDTT